MTLLELLGDILGYMTAGNRAKSRLWLWVNRLTFWLVAALAAYLIYVTYIPRN